MKRTCLNCGWVHFGVKRKYAENAVAKFNEYYEAQDDETKGMFGGPSNIDQYLYCCKCEGSYQNFRKAREDDCPEGCTLSPIIHEGVDDDNE